MIGENAYLSRLARDIAQTYEGRLHELCLVLPSSQATHFFRNHLGRELEGPTWSPAAYQLPSLMQELVWGHVPPTLTLLGHLYQVTQKVTHKELSFFDFLPWGRQFLHALEEMAHYLVPVEHFFSQGASDDTWLSSSSKEQVRDFWQSFQDPQGLQKGFLDHCSLGAKVYEAFRTHLRQHGILYRGMHYQEVYQQLLAGEVALPYKHIVAIGIHPVTPLTKKIFEALEQYATVDFYYDTDAYYMEHEAQETGYYLRQYAKDPLLGKHLQGPYKRAIEEKKGHLHYVASPTQVGQVEAVAAIVVRLMREDADFAPEKAAIVLADSSLLLPLLHALPAALPLDLSVQYPFSETPLYDLLVALLTFHRHGAAQAVSGREPMLEALKRLLYHAYTRLPKALSKRVLSCCEAGDMASLQQDEALPVVWRHMLSIPRGDMPLWVYLVRFLTLLMEGGKVGERWVRWEEAGLQKALEACKAMEKMPLEVLAGRVSIDHCRFFTKMFQGLSFSIRQHNENGVKVVFVNNALYLHAPYLFMLSMNEGSFPLAAQKGGLLPVSLREAYGLPGMYEQSASYAYLFYTLLQQAAHAFFFYHEGKSMGASCEVSRYLLQLQYEGNLSITTDKKNTSIVPLKGGGIRVAKDGDVLLALDAFLAGKGTRSLTPSAINTYLDCGLRFYFQYLAKLKVPEPPSVMASPALFGQLLHRVMELLYRDYVGEEVTRELLGHCLRKVSGVIHRVLADAVKEEGGLRGGVVGFVAKLLEKLVVKIVEIDQAEAPFVLRGVEVGRYTKLVTLLPLTDGRLVTLGGIVDRIDQKKDTVRIVDYKTSAWHGKVSDLSSLFEKGSLTRNKVALQIMWYGWLYGKHASAQGVKVAPNVVSVRDLLKPSPSFSLSLLEGKHYIPVEDSKRYAAHFEKLLQETLEELYDPKKCFEQTDEVQHCSFCPYREICHEKSI